MTEKRLVRENTTISQLRDDEGLNQGGGEGNKRRMAKTIQKWNSPIWVREVEHT